MKIITAHLTAAAAVIACLCPATSQAQATFDLSSTSTVAPCTGYTAAMGNNIVCNRTNASGAAKVDVSAWSTPTVGFTFASGSFESAQVNDQDGSGIGAYNQTETTSAGSPSHAFDNITPGLVDMVMLNFKDASNANIAVSLASLKMGWTGKDTSTTLCDLTPAVLTSTACDSDISVFRWTGSASGPTVSGTGTAETLGASGGWTLVGSYGDLAAGATRTITGDTSISSSWWLISSFSSSLAGSGSCRVGSETTGSGTGTCENSNDAFKLNFLTTAAPAVCAGGSTGPGANGLCSSSSSVPEPTPVGLLSLALLGMAGVRRRVFQRG